MIGLSQSTLAIFQDCARCFWQAKVAKVERPRGIFPSLPSAMDKVMKEMVERQLLAAEDIHYLNGSSCRPYADRQKVEVFRSWRTFQTLADCDGMQVKLWGELDDLLIHPDGKVSPWDFKSKGSAPGDAEEYSRKYYQLQADLYPVLLKSKGLDPSGFCYFTYTWPVQIDGGVIVFDHATCRIESDPKRVLTVARAATECLDGPCPPPGLNCEWCSFVERRAEKVIA